VVFPLGRRVVERAKHELIYSDTTAVPHARDNENGLHACMVCMYNDSIMFIQHASAAEPGVQDEVTDPVISREVFYSTLL